MGYYENKKQELEQLLSLVRKEKSCFEKAVKLEKDKIEKDKQLLQDLGISETSPLKEAKDNLDKEEKNFESSKSQTLKQLEKKPRGRNPNG